MINVTILGVVVIQIDVVKERLLFKRVVHGETRDQQMRTETIDLIFDCVLKAFHN